MPRDFLRISLDPRPASVTPLRRGAPSGPGRIILTVLLVGLLGACARQPGIQTVLVAEFKPDGEVEPYTNVTIVFSRAICPADSVDLFLESAAVEFEPALEGRYKWVDTHTLRFMPAAPLAPSTSYEALISPAVTGSSELVLRGERRFSFHTPTIAVEDVAYSIERETGEAERGRFLFEVVFNAEVAPEMLAEHLVLRSRAAGPAGKVPCTITSTAAGTRLSFESDRIDLSDEKGKLQLEIGAGLLPVGGAIGLPEQFTRAYPFATAEFLTVESVRPVQQTSSRYAIAIRFSSPVSVVEARRFIRIDPVTEFSIADSRSGIQLSGDFRAGQTYTVTIDEGLRGQDGSRLRRSLRQPVIMGDLRPDISFTSPGLFLSREGLHNVGIDVVNMSELSVDLYKVFPNNLVHYLQHAGYYYGNMESYGHAVWHSEQTLSIPQNEKRTLTVNLGSFLDDHPSGLFKLLVRGEGRYWRSDARTVLLTDIGLVGKRSLDELHLWALSTTTLEPLAGVELTLMSRSNQVMGRARTDGDGSALISSLAAYGEEFDPYLVLAERGEEISFLRFEDCEVATADFDVAGRPHLQRGYEAFLYGDRGVYRPGDVVHIACLVRGADNRVPEPFPLRLAIKRPDGRDLEEQQARSISAGAVEFTVPVPSYAPTGRYLAELYAVGETPIGQLDFSVEEFIPDRIRVEVETDRASYRQGETARVTVTGTMLFGPPAAGRRLEAALRFEPVPFAPPGYASYTFGDPELEFTGYEMTADAGQLDAAGHGTVSFEIPAKMRPPAALQGIVTATVHENGGRAVTARHTIEVHPYPFYVGLRRRQEGYAEIGIPQEFEFVVLEPDGAAAAPEKLEARFEYMRWHTSLVRDPGGRYRYVSRKSPEHLQTVEVSPETGRGSFVFTPPEWGQFRVTLTDPDTGARTALLFYASGWGYTPWSLERPGVIDLELDAASYEPGQEARVLVKAPFGGRLILTVEREKVLWSRVVELEENTAELRVRVQPEYMPNVYVTATLVRPRDEADPGAPLRAWGAVPLMVDDSPGRLDLALAVPDETRPLEPLTIDLDLTETGSDRPPADVAVVTIAAVDEGILQLTGFETPDPVAFFHGKESLDVRTFDIFALLLPELEASAPLSAAGGDRMAAMRMEHLSPVTARRVKPVALWSGLLETDPDGHARTTFEVPAFNGTLRVMAVASAGSRFGAVAREVRVSEPIVLTPTFPRFCAPGDRFEVPVTLYNDTGRQGRFTLTLTAEGPAAVLGETRVTVEAAAGQEVAAGFRVEAARAVGTVTFTLTASGNEAAVESETELPVRPVAPPETRSSSGSVAGGERALFTLPGGFVSGSIRATLTVSPFPTVEYSGSLQELLRYPYGCAEQTVSQAFPLLYFKDLARQVEPELFDTNAPEYYVEEAIRKLGSMQLASGGFTFWPRSPTVNEWTSVYAMHFMAEARRAGYSLSRRMLSRGIGYLRQLLFARESAPRGSSALQPWILARDLRIKSYAAYVLALLDEPEPGTMSFLLETYERDLTLDARILLAGAFALTGDTSTAFRLLPASVNPQSAEARETGGTFSSSVRDNALILTILADIAPDHAGIPVLVSWLSRQASIGRWGTTQENAWAFLALGKVMQQQPGGAYTGSITVDGEQAAELTPETVSLAGTHLAGAPVVIEIEGEGRAYFYWEVRGVAVGQSYEEASRGLQVSRRYLRLDGTPAGLDSLAHGELVLVELNITAASQSIENVVIDDMLPAGLEIENPRLESRADLPRPETGTVLVPDYMDIRDDRLLLFTNLTQGRTMVFRYAARAVTAGWFTLPPVAAECMYDTSLKSIAGSGALMVRHR